jgi:hypothetical protein
MFKTVAELIAPPLVALPPVELPLMAASPLWAVALVLFCKVTVALAVATGCSASVVEDVVLPCPPSVDEDEIAVSEGLVVVVSAVVADEPVVLTTADVVVVVTSVAGSGVSAKVGSGRRTKPTVTSKLQRILYK